MAQKVVTAHKMKLRQETTSLGQIATVAAKPTISDNKHLQTPTQEALKFRRATWDPSPPPRCRAFVPISLGVGEYIVDDSLLYCGVGIVLCLYCLWHYSRTSTNSHLSTVHTFTLVSTSLQWPLFFVPKVAIVESGSTVYQIIGDCKCPQHQKTTTQFSSEH